MNRNSMYSQFDGSNPRGDFKRFESQIMALTCAKELYKKVD